MIEMKMMIDGISITEMAVENVSGHRKIPAISMKATNEVM
jgi:hypothetical protein